MTLIEKHRWRIHWGDKVFRTRWHMTEEEARAKDPQAEKIPGTLMVITPPESSTHYISVSGAAERDRR